MRSLGESGLTKLWEIIKSTFAMKSDIASTKYVGTATGSATYHKISDFGNWGTGAWYQKGFSMLITSRAGEMVWVTVAANDSNTDARAFRLMNCYSKISNIYYSASESAIYVKAAAWANNICAHILSNVGGDYVPNVSTVSALASDCVEINIVEFGINATSAVVGDSSVLLEMGGSADRPTYNGSNIALQSDIPTVPTDYLSTSGGSISGGLSVSNKITQGSTSADPTIASMNRYQSDLYIQGDGSAPNNPIVPGFYLGKSQSDDNRHMDIVSGGDYSYIDFNKASNGSDYDARLLVNVSTGYTEWCWGGAAPSKAFNVLGTLQQSGQTVATQPWVQSLGYMTSLPARIASYQDHTVPIADPNNAVETGFYYINAATNRPPFSQSTNWDYRVLTTAYSDQWLQQIATDFRCSDVFVRRRENGVWKPWEKLAYSSEIPSLDGCAKLTAPNDLVHNGNEVTMVPDAYSAGYLYLNYRTASGNQNGSINNYLFCNGHGGTSGVTLTADAFTGTAAKANSDGNGNNIASTYVPITDDYFNTVEVRSGDEYAGLMVHLGGTNGEAILAAESASSVAEIRVNAYGDGAIKMSAASVSVNDDPIATQAWVGGQGYLKSVPSEYVTETELAAKSYATKAELEAATGVDMSAYLPKTGGVMSGNLDFSNSSAWLTPYLLAFKNADANQSPTYPYTGFYQWGDEWQVNARDANNSWARNVMAINLVSGVADFAARPTVNGAGVAMQSDLSAYQTAPVTLYDNASGTTGTVTLSESAANFSYIEVFAYCGSSKRSASVKVPAPNGKTATLFIPWGGDSANWEYRGGWAISGATMTCSLNHTYNPGTSATASTAKNEMYVCKVVGYR